MSSWRGRSVLVVGLGASGFASASALLKLGARVFATDSSTSPAIVERAARLSAEGARVTTGGHDLSAIEADVAVVSPGVPPEAPVMRALRSARIEIIAEIELAAQLARCDFLAVTGTNGKTTTTSLLAAMLAESGVSSAAAGNIGLPLVEAIERVPGGAIAVEVSSFQLTTIKTFRPRVAVLLNIAEDHTDWHGDFDSYVRAKARIVANQTPQDVFVYNADDEHTRAVARLAASRSVPFSLDKEMPDGICLSRGDVSWRERAIMSVDDIPLRGRGGREDVLAASAAALEYGVDASAVARAVARFEALPHRMQWVAEIEGVTYIDDSKATNPHATLAAMAGLCDVVLVAGGRAKGIALTPLRDAVPPVVAVVALGEAASEIAGVFEGLVPVVKAESMDEAVRAARRNSVTGGSVLLSPACASLDMYESYAARGRDFARAVNASTGDGERRSHSHA